MKHSLHWKKINKKTKEVVEERTEEFANIYNLERRKFEIEDIEILDERFKIQTHVRKVGE